MSIAVKLWDLFITIVRLLFIENRTSDMINATLFLKVQNQDSYKLEAVVLSQIA